MLSLEFLNKIRTFEVNMILPIIPSGSSILEIGAGTGWQARILAEHGFNITAIDVPDCNYNDSKVWNIIDYDGVSIPFPDNHFDVIFSSNVLEHIPHIFSFQKEMMRILKPKGIAIILLPTGTWRFWTNLTHYFYLVQIGLIFLFQNSNLSNKNQLLIEKSKKLGIKQKIKKVIFSSCHGVHGNSISEIYYFSRYRWIRLFHSTGWVLVTYFKNNLFYSGYGILDKRLSITIRYYLSYLFGSSSHIFVLRKNY
jgi:ubiquinone/menaquinone biosynthesis C-methylase UbiE